MDHPIAPPKGANSLVEARLSELLKEIEKETDTDCLFYSGPIAFGADNRIRDAVESFDVRRGKLLFILETSGGFAEDARRVSDVLRHHFCEVDFLIPSHAMSAGTILALSGNAIWMDYYSVLGPIDPQVPSQDGRQFVPALGYLVRYEELVDKANRGEAGAAELQILVNSFDQGELYKYTQSRDLSVALLVEWLEKYKFKYWNKTESRKKRVTRKMKKERAREIANELNNPNRWNSHGIGINMEVLRRELKLHIDDFGESQPLRIAVRNYHKLVTDYALNMRFDSLVQTREIVDGRRWGE